MSRKIQNLTVQFKSIIIDLMFTKLALPNENFHETFTRIEILYIISQHIIEKEEKTKFNLQIIDILPIISLYFIEKCQ